MCRPVWKCVFESDGLKKEKWPIKYVTFDYQTIKLLPVEAEMHISFEFFFSWRLMASVKVESHSSVRFPD